MKISPLFPRPLAPEKCDWQAEWERLYAGYSLNATARSLSHDRGATYYPPSPTEWAKMLANEIPPTEKKLYSDLARRWKQAWIESPGAVVDEKKKEEWERHADYLMTVGRPDAEIRGFALYWTLKEAEHGGVTTRHCDEGSANRLVLRFYAFAGARYDYHCEIVKRGYPEALKGILRSEGMLLDGKKLVTSTEHFRQPKRWQDPELDLWLILAWPVVTQNDWNYADVARARRVKFAELPKGTKSFVTPEGARKATERALDGKQSSFAEYVNDKQGTDEGDWWEHGLNVTRSERGAMEQRCRKLGLRLSKTPRRSMKKPPSRLEFALSITA